MHASPEFPRRNSHCSFYRAAAVALALTALSAAIPDNAEARTRQRSGTYTTGAGRTGAYSGSASGNLRSGLTRNQSVTAQNGNTYNRSATETYNAQSGAFNKTVTAPNGTTRTYTGTAADGQRSGTYTTSSGQSGSFSGSTTGNGNGSVTNSGTVTTSGGNTYNRSATTGYDPSTHTVTRSVTGPAGNTRDGSVTYTPTPTN